ncbi:MAG: hypothetical protein U5N55_04950 [Cypionkella sp.]|nr:hypothetical protein [Cypionkella sp.]
MTTKIATIVFLVLASLDVITSIFGTTSPEYSDIIRENAKGTPQ